MANLEACRNGNTAELSRELGGVTLDNQELQACIHNLLEHIMALRARVSALEMRNPPMIGMGAVGIGPQKKLDPEAERVRRFHLEMDLRAAINGAAYVLDRDGTQVRKEMAKRLREISGAVLDELRCKD